MGNDKPYDPKHAGDAEDAQARADILNSLPTYDIPTPASQATQKPAPVDPKPRS